MLYKLPAIDQGRDTVKEAQDALAPRVRHPHPISGLSVIDR